MGLGQECQGHARSDVSVFAPQRSARSSRNVPLVQPAQSIPQHLTQILAKMFRG